MNDNNKNLNNTNINFFPGHMQKAKRLMREKMNLIDVVLEVIDARMPLSSKIVDIDELLKNKKKILIVSKYDLCDKKETEQFITYYENKGYKVIPMDLKSGNISIIIDSIQNLMQEEKKKRKQKGMKERNIRVLVVGVPNVGKSTLINRLVGKKKAGVGNKPGFTKEVSWIRLKNNMELLDSPGILWPKFENQEVAKTLASLASIKEEAVDEFTMSNFILQKMMKLYPESLEKRYHITTLSEDYIEEYDKIAKMRGALKRGGVADYEKVSRMIIKDLQNGYLGCVTFDRIEDYDEEERNR